MMSRRRLAVFVAIIAIAAVSVLGGAAGIFAADPPIPIGVSVAQTGPVALAGQEQVLGAQIAEDYFNKHGGVNGRPIKLVFQDGGSDEPTAINAFQNLINVAKVVGIMGPSLSQQAFAADPFAVRAKVPVIGPSNTAKGIPQIGEYVSRVSAPVAIVAPNAVKAAMEMNKDLKKVAVLYAQNDAFNKSETETFQQAVKDLKLDLATVQTFQTTDTDFTAQITNVLNVKPDLVIISGLQVDGANLIKQLRDLGYKGLIVGGNGVNTAAIYPDLQGQVRRHPDRPGLQPRVQEQDQRRVQGDVQGQAEEGPAPVQRPGLRGHPGVRGGAARPRQEVADRQDGPRHAPRRS